MLATPFQKKLLLAAISGALIPLSYEIADWLPESHDAVDLFLMFGVPGILFAVGVLLPCLERNSRFWPHAIAAAALSTFSYWSAFMVAQEISNASGNFLEGPDLASYVAASLVGASIVLVAIRFIMALTWTSTYWGLGIVTSVISGGLFWAVYKDNSWLQLLAYAQWHLFISVPIHFGLRSGR